ncbi:MAG TPA: TOMM precursor leader peptide-binding protein [Allosphingosinicella sp.]|nr:TOMM precursor leader peptide-binding protein [Allosphingosinicella sp.]
MTFYRAIAGIDAVRLEDEAVLLRSDMLSCRLEGASAAVAAERLLPALSEWRSGEALVGLLPDYASEDVEALVGELVAAGFVRARPSPPDGDEPAAASALAGFGIDEARAAGRLASLRIGLVGLDRVGLLVAGALGEAGVGTLLLADPARQGAAAEALAPGCRSRLELAPDPLDRAGLEALAGDLDLIVVTVDRGFLVARHWANRAALASGRPALFADLALSEALIGPTLLPGESACYMCFRMRHLATLDKFAEGFALERHLDARRDPSAARPLLPGLAEAAAGLVVGEAMRLLFGPLVPAYVNAVAQLDAGQGTLVRHQLARQPECPHCRGIDVAVRSGG